MRRTKRIIPAILIITLILGLVAPVGLNSKVQPVRMSDDLVKVTAKAPDQTIRVIVRVRDWTAEGEQFVEQSGGKVLKALPLINAFAAELPAQSLVQLARMNSVEWISLDARVMSTVKPVKHPESLVENNPENQH